MNGQFLVAQILLACVMGIKSAEANDTSPALYLDILAKLSRELESPAYNVQDGIAVHLVGEAEPRTLRPSWVEGLRDFMRDNGKSHEEVGDVLVQAGYAIKQRPTELEMHRADHQAVKDAGFGSPGELLNAYKRLAEDDNQHRRQIDDLIEKLTAANKSKIKPWTGAEIRRLWNNSRTEDREHLPFAAFERLTKYIEQCHGIREE